MAAMSKDWYHDKMPRFSGGLLFLAFLILFMIEKDVTTPTKLFVLGNITSIVLCVWLFDFSGKYGFKESFILNKLGSISYETYLLHGIVMMSLRSKTLYIADKWIFCLLTIFITILCAFIFHWVIDKMLWNADRLTISD